MKISYDDFLILQKKVSDLEIELEYLPTKSDLEHMVSKDLDKYALFLLWLTQHHPRTADKEEGEIIRMMTNLRNIAFELEFLDEQE